jgi:predicted RNA-binding Zn-ribbon protein involved in translation (DUF1610 family)
MTAPALWLDGNAIAGLLAEVLGTDMTTAPRDCPSCGRRSALGEHRAYAGAGVVLRCPGCGAVALRIAVLPDRTVLRLTGTWTLEVPRP